MLCTPATNTPPLSTPAMRVSSPKRTTGKRMLFSSYSLSLNSRIKMLKCDKTIEGLSEMEDIIKALKLEYYDYCLKAMM